MNDYRGVIIEESLDKKDVLNEVKILETKLSNVTDKHQTPWLKQWTMHTVIVPEAKAQEIAEKLSKSLEKEHNWYADYRNKTHHYIIFRDKVFFVDRTSIDEYNEAKEYGLSLGIPYHQVDFHPDVKDWEGEE